MLRVFGQDGDLKAYAYACYEYPTSLNRMPFTTRMAGVQEIANGLRTHIETHFEDKTQILLVGHSLGGVIARQYILDAVKSGRDSKTSALALFATPHTGAALANVGTAFSFRHRHLRQLCRGSDILDIINSDWVKLKVEEKIRTLYIVGGCDSVVLRESAAPYLGADNVRTLIGHGHVEVIKPTDQIDTRFKILKDFVLKSMPESISLPQLDKTQSMVQGDVLFDVYSAASEPYYIERATDKTIYEATRAAYAWISGPPGVGKTAALKRLVEISGWKLQHVMLDSYSGLAALDLMREVGNVLCERAGIEPNGIPKHIDVHALYGYFRRAITNLSGTGPLAILIEEIPLPSGQEYTKFLEIAYHLAQCSETDTASNRVIWLFSSIRNPRCDLRHATAKFLERVQLISIEPWTDYELRKLIDLICEGIEIDLSSENKETILKKAGGSPRFIKMIFRRMRNEVARNKKLAELITSVEMDLA